MLQNRLYTHHLHAHLSVLISPWRCHCVRVGDWNPVGIRLRIIVLYPSAPPHPRFFPFQALNEAVFQLVIARILIHAPTARLATIGELLIARCFVQMSDFMPGNGYTQTGGGGLEMIGGADGVHALLLQVSCAQPVI